MLRQPMVNPVVPRGDLKSFDTKALKMTYGSTSRRGFIDASLQSLLWHSCHGPMKRAPRPALQPARAHWTLVLNLIDGLVPPRSKLLSPSTVKSPAKVSSYFWSQVPSTFRRRLPNFGTRKRYATSKSRPAVLKLPALMFG